MKRILCTLAVALAFSAAPAHSESVQRVIDGDTVVMQGGERIRIACIDTERGEYGFDAATRFTRSKVSDKDVQVRRITRDRYGRTVGEIYADGINIGKALVDTGHARIYWRYAKQCAWTGVIDLKCL